MLPLIHCIFQSLEMASVVVVITEEFYSPGCAVASPGLINIVTKGASQPSIGLLLLYSHFI